VCARTGGWVRFLRVKCSDFFRLRVIFFVATYSFAISRSLGDLSCICVWVYQCLRIIQNTCEGVNTKCIMHLHIMSPEP
jgi:hypothetical protein